ncbi:MAG TPA: matrixin family metalloprotease [Bacteroidia bacterium]|nr:matrixin family metalloprotease [Bacteroidia bacterium]
MKIIGSLLLLSAVIAFSSFRRLGTTLANASFYPLYYNSGLPTNYNDFVQIIATAGSDMSPNGYLTNGGPTFYSQGASPSPNTLGPTTGNGYCEIGIGGGPPEALMITYRTIVTGVSTHSEFDIVINTSSNGFSQWGTGNSGSNTYDRCSYLKHELGHGVGLDHTSKSELMAPVAVLDKVLNVKNDDIQGFKCIYQGDCYGEQSAGNLTITTNVSRSPVKSYLIWNLETESDKFITGFNLLKRDKKTLVYKSVNSVQIPVNTSNNYYAYRLPKETDFSKSEYYLETVYSEVKCITKFDVNRRITCKPGQKDLKD